MSPSSNSIDARTDAPDAAENSALQRGFLGHPKPLATLFSVEMWERFSFYGMQAILAYYMYYSVAEGGLGMDQALAVSLVGAYGGGVYLSTILGAWLAEVLQTHSPVNMRVRAVSVYSHLWTVTLPTVRPFSTNSCASRSVVGEIGASVVVAVVRMRP